MMGGRRVLLLYSESRLTPSVVSADQALRSTLEARLAGPIYFYTEFLDLNSLHGASLQRELPKLLRVKYRERPIDLIVAQGELSVPFTLQNRIELFSSAPVVFVAVEASTFADPSLRSFATGTWRRRGWAVTLDLACRLHPETRRAIVIVGSSKGELLWMESARQQLAACSRSIEISYLIDRPFEDIVKAVAAPPKDTVVIAGPFLRDATGRDFATPIAISQIAAVSNVPVYALTEACIGTGVVGGQVVSFEAHGRAAAELAVQVLAGERPSPTEAGTTIPMFDDRQIKRWGIDRRLLPAASVVLFREPSVWGRSRKYFAAFLGGQLVRRAHQGLGKRPRFETLVSDLSTTFSSCPPAEVDVQVQTGLRRVVDDLGMDHAAIWELPDRSDVARLTHSWARAGIPLPPPAVKECESPLIFSRLRRGNGVHADRADEDTIGRVELEHFGVRSTALVPLFDGGSVVGGLSVATASKQQATEEMIPRLRLLAEIFANALARQRAARAAYESAEHIRDLAGRLMTSQEEERRRIARELHDGVNQDLAALAIALNAIEEGQAAPTQRREVARLRGRTVELAESVRRLSHELHPGILQYAGLVAALRSHCREFEREHGLAVKFRADDDLGAVPPDVGLCLYRVAQEALKNAASHAKASHVSVDVARNGANLVLTIGDDGNGFDLAEARNRGGLGLISLDERARLVRGHLAIDSWPQRGTQIQVVVPLPAIHDGPSDDSAR